MTPPDPRPALLALDFDGVVCDTVREALRSAWEVCRELGVVGAERPPGDLAERFVRLRPVVEFGWEFPLLALALLDQASEEQLLQGFQTVWRRRVLERHRVMPEELGARFDAVRDRAIRRDLDGWLAEQGLYPGVGDRLRRALAEGIPTFVITTKEGRFAHRLLAVAGVPFPAEQVWGKEQARPKPDLLRALIGRYGLAPGDVWFVEDRLQTLEAVEREQDLAAVGLFLATWGYTLPPQRAEAERHPRIRLLTLAQFGRDFGAWLERPDGRGLEVPAGR
jgi:phosphoglycolate phosphatase-like HAD superfamily hydrolase